MKKVIVTKENYEEVMFDLLENNYPREVRENILDQIHADTFLNFEWQQWSKATYSESTEVYKNTEAAFIENLTKEKKKKGVMYYIIPMATVATVLLFISIYFLYNRHSVKTPALTNHSVQEKAIEKSNAPAENSPETPLENHGENKLATQLLSPQKLNMVPPVDKFNTDPVNVKQNTVLVVEKQEKIIYEVPTFMDTIKTMIAAAKKQPRYKITIVEGPAEILDENKFLYIEKRYTMADVLNRKDGITLSKFFQNSNSRIVTDSATNTVTIEYIAIDHSVLVLTLSN